MTEALAPGGLGSARERPGERPRYRVALAATFTADPVMKAIRFWMDALEIPADVQIAPYAQVMQQLLNPHSLLSQNRSGFNLLLIRLGDWTKDRVEASAQHNLQHLKRAADEFVAAVSALQARTTAPVLILFCPSSSATSAVIGESPDAIERDLAARCSAIPNVHCWAHADVVRLYPISQYEDAVSDRAGHIPYTNEYFIALATLLSRRITALLKTRRKVISIDCDNTLWTGICGEDGPTGVELLPANLYLQKELVRQHDAGVLLCLCSKNNENDVERVFSAHPEMPLRPHHFVTSRVNWNTKSSNLRSIADELSLSLDSFIFIDDSAMECAEVRAHCPTVLILQFPQKDVEVRHFLDHVWAFDLVGVTEEAKRRTALYKQERARNRALEDSTDLAGFLTSLELEVQTSIMEPGDLPRVAELVQRTNQFNLTTVRRSASEIDGLCAAGDVRSLIVRVRDRFGDYGLVGALLIHLGDTALDVDTFVLSCRVLGRGVEHRIVNELARIAGREGVSHIVLRHRATPRNVPARTFLEMEFGSFEVTADGVSKGDTLFRIPIDYAENLVCDRPDPSPRTESTTPPQAPSALQQTSPEVTWHEIAYRLSRIAEIAKEIGGLARKGGDRAAYVAPRTPTEAVLATIWQDVLGVESLSIHADFFDLGGDSLMAVQAIARIAAELGSELSVYEFFEGPTVEAVAARVDDSELSSSIRDEISQMQNEAVLAEIAALEQELNAPGDRPGRATQ